MVVLATASVTTAAAGDWTSQVGLQLDSVGGGMAKNMDQTLGKVQDFGFKYVELVGDYGRSVENLTNALASHHLTAVSAHFPYARLRDDPEGVSIEAERLGLKYAGCPSVPQKGSLDLAGCEAAIAVFNRAGEAMARHHVEFFYHPHGYEFKPYADGTYFDLLAAKTDPKFVHFEMDVFWVVHAGQDPLKLFAKYGNRWMAMHLKDMKKGTPTGLFTGHSDKSTFVPVGQGQIDIAAIIPAAHALGIQWFFIEDESAAPEASIPQSVGYLSRMNW